MKDMRVKKQCILCKTCHLNVHHDPVYCQVIIDRWEKFTEKEVIKE